MKTSQEIAEDFALTTSASLFNRDCVSMGHVANVTDTIQDFIPLTHLIEVARAANHINDTYDPKNSDYARLDATLIALRATGKAEWL